ncbi:aldehyde dehydrogenase family protein [Alicyclobacillus mengziensis]|uniref:Aldehyde dehydrogenase family protein n=1 Tax=Alicyclobacillus mengziensis TaxID=2931921 RepID=A0A9X7W206_9BACL|nr:aldehyde dehydrogenase family protein [Alicyclobacillus mengziensis]QSO49251.1 aldehyde dehydrogenase family protein [Alicyclobacillus mengziensis]
MGLVETPTTYRNYIGNWVESGTAAVFRVENPADTRDVIGFFQQSDEADVEKAVTTARAAFPDWRSTPAPQRGEFMFRAAQIIEDDFDGLVQLLTREVGKSLKDSRAEVRRTINVLRFLGGEGTRLAGETVPSWQQGVVAYTKRYPLGVVGVITPWNVPSAIAAWKIASALVAGNTVIFKPSSLTPTSSLKLVQAFVDAGVPAGVLNFVTGPGGKVGNAIAAHPDVRAVSFTGSNSIGSAINKVVTARGARFQGEMGGKNPFIVMPDADLELAVNDVIAGGLGEAGQRCTATSRVLVFEEIADKFTKMLVNRISSMKIGNPKEESVEMGPLADEGQMNTSLHYIEVGKQEGARLLCGGERLTEGDLAYGYYVAPTVFSGVVPDMTIAQDEIFGPVISVMTVHSFEQAIDWANNIRYGLSSTIYTNNYAKATEFIDQIQAGLTHVNMPTTYSEPQYPFGGIKATGLGGVREQGSTAMDFYTEWKTVYTKPKD